MNNFEDIVDGVTDEELEKVRANLALGGEIIFDAMVTLGNFFQDLMKSPLVDEQAMVVKAEMDKGEVTTGSIKPIHEEVAAAGHISQNLLVVRVLLRQCLSLAHYKNPVVGEYLRKIQIHSLMHTLGVNDADGCKDNLDVVNEYARVLGAEDFSQVLFEDVVDTVIREGLVVPNILMRAKDAYGQMPGSEG